MSHFVLLIEIDIFLFFYLANQPCVQEQRISENNTVNPGGKFLHYAKKEVCAIMLISYLQMRL